MGNELLGIKRHVSHETILKEVEKKGHEYIETVENMRQSEQLTREQWTLFVSLSREVHKELGQTLQKCDVPNQYIVQVRGVHIPGSSGHSHPQPTRDRHQKGPNQKMSEQKPPQAKQSKQPPGQTADDEFSKLYYDLVGENEKLLGQIKPLEEEVANLKKECKKMEGKNNDLMLRLSKIAGDKINLNNPAITDLSDQNRPTRLGEFYSELYANEWTDAFEALTHAGYSDCEAIDTLRDTLLDTFKFCQHKAEILVTKAKEAVDELFEEYRIKHESQKETEMPTELQKELALKERWIGKLERTARAKSAAKGADDDMTRPDVDLYDKFQGFRKEVATSLMPVIQKAYLKTLWDKTCLPAMRPFIKKCLFIGWLMVVQTPPLCFDESKVGDAYDTGKYRAYTSGGPKVAQIVWPALQLHEMGPFVCKGVAQGTK